jgi:phenylacetate-coenzyme A ligase PaaK-like adenylate-forming protein
MTPGHRLARLGYFARALRAARADARNERLPPTALRALQQERLERIVRHAAAHSPIYRELYRGIDLSRPIELSRLPPTGKAALMERFDEWVTDPRIRLSDVEAHVASLRGDELFRDEYRTCATGGTSGRRCVFLFSRAEWITAVAGLLRWSAFAGVTPRLPRRRVANVMAAHPLHMTARFGLTTDVGAHRVRRFDARRPVREIAAELDAFRPEALSGYPSVLALLADEQLAGRLRIAPRTVTTTSEVRTRKWRSGSPPPGAFGRSTSTRRRKPASSPPTATDTPACTSSRTTCSSRPSTRTGARCRTASPATGSC